MLVDNSTQPSHAAQPLYEHARNYLDRSQRRDPPATQNRPEPSAPLPARQRDIQPPKPRTLRPEPAAMPPNSRTPFSQLRADTGRHPRLIGYPSKGPKAPYSEA